jgi:hypothetical protein
MKTKLFAVLGILALLTAMLPAAVSAAPPPPYYKAVDVGPRLRELGPSDVTLHLDGFEDAYAEASSSNSSQPDFYGEGDIKTAIWYDDTAGLYLADYEVRAIGDHIEVWVMTDLNFPDGDPRNPVVVTQEQIDYLVDEFDNNIYPNTEGFFGAADFHDGSNAALPFDYYDPEGRTIAMISNIGDESYYDPSYPNYIAGFYWGSVFELYLDRNVISIDAFDWANRVGPNVARPYLYEGVFAHEYQHLLHDDYNPGEENFINEGLSMFTEFLVGYAVGNNDAYSTFEALPENSLTVWGDQGGPEIVADYGQTFLFHMYLYEKFGPAFMQYEFHNPDNGVSGINSTLDAFNIQQDFGDIYHDLSVAVLIDDEKSKNGRYGFDNHEVAIDIGTPGAPNPDAYDTPGAPPWGSDYIWIEGNPKDLAKFTFNGVDFAIYNTPWTSDGDVLYGGSGDLVDNFAIFETTGGGTLTFDTMYQIEEQWDFGFVQVSTDGGYTWTSLTNAYTAPVLNPDTHPNIIANGAGLTGDSGGWVNMSFDLSGYSGPILVAFRYMTDWAFNDPGWYIDNVMVDSDLISDGTDASVFTDITEIIPVNLNFTVTFVGMKKNQYKVKSVNLNDASEEGLFELGQILKWSDQAVMIVTFDAPEGFTGYGDYTYDFTYTNKGPKK